MTADEVDPDGIVPTSIVPEYCSQCGTALGRRPFEGGELPWCPECRLLFSKNPVPGVQVIVHGDDAVLVVSEPHVEGTLWNFPGGHADPGERPTEAVLRELEEETSLSADPDDLVLFDVHHGDFPRTDYYMITYTIDRGDIHGTPDAADEVEAAEFWPPADLLDAPDVTRQSDRAHVRELFDLS